MDAAGTVLDARPRESESLYGVWGDSGVFLSSVRNDDRRDTFQLRQWDGSVIASWDWGGVQAPSFVGDQRLYFSIATVMADAAGRFYLYNESNNLLVIYGPGGELQHAIPTRNLGSSLDALWLSQSGDLWVQQKDRSSNTATLRHYRSTNPVR
jgi:hypothetical protein